MTNARRYTKAEIIQAREDLVKQGLLRDSGKRRRDPRTGEMQIVWEAVPAAEAADKPQ